MKAYLVYSCAHGTKNKSGLERKPRPQNVQLKLKLEPLLRRACACFVGPICWCGKPVRYFSQRVSMTTAEGILYDRIEFSVVTAAPDCKVEIAFQNGI